MVRPCRKSQNCRQTPAMRAARTFKHTHTHTHTCDVHTTHAHTGGDTETDKQIGRQRDTRDTERKLGRFGQAGREMPFHKQNSRRPNQPPHDDGVHPTLRQAAGSFPRRGPVPTNALQLLMCAKAVHGSERDKNGQSGLFSYLV